MQMQCRNHKTSKTSYMYAIQVTKEILICNQFVLKNHWCYMCRNHLQIFALKNVNNTKCDPVRSNEWVFRPVFFLNDTMLLTWMRIQPHPYTFRHFIRTPASFTTLNKLLFILRYGTLKIKDFSLLYILNYDFFYSTKLNKIYLHLDVFHQSLRTLAPKYL